MRDWKAVARAFGVSVPPEDLERLVKPLDALEETFRPLVAELPPEAEPASGFAAEDEQ